MTMHTLTHHAAPRPKVATAMAALVVATLMAIAVVIAIQDDPDTAPAGATVSNEQSVELGRQVGSADALERRTELESRTGRGSPDAIDRVNTSSGAYGSPDAAEQWTER